MTGRRSAIGQRGFMWKDQAFEELGSTRQRTVDTNRIRQKI